MALDSWLSLLAITICAVHAIHEPVLTAFNGSLSAEFEEGWFYINGHAIATESSFHELSRCMNASNEGYGLVLDVMNRVESNLTTSNAILTTSSKGAITNLTLAVDALKSLSADEFDKHDQKSSLRHYELLQQMVAMNASCIDAQRESRTSVTDNTEENIQMLNASIVGVLKQLQHDNRELKDNLNAANRMLSLMVDSIANLTRVVETSQTTQPMAATCPILNFQTGLSAYWTFDELLNGGVLDSSDNGINLACINDCPDMQTDARFGRSRLFSNNRLACHDASCGILDMSSQDGVSYGFWFKVSTGSAGGVVLAKAKGYGQGMGLYVNDDESIFSLGGNPQCSNNEHDLRTGPNQYIKGRWQHFVMTQDPGTPAIMRIYLDGEQIASRNDTYHCDVGTDFVIGGLYRPTFSGFTSALEDVSVDEVFAYRRSLSEDQVRTMFQLSLAERDACLQASSASTQVANICGSLSRGLRAWWTFDAEVDGQFRSASNGYKLSCGDDGCPAVVEGIHGRAVSFNGNDDHVLTCADSVCSEMDQNSQTGSSWGIWLRPTKMQQSYVLTKVDGYGQGFAVNLFADGRMRVKGSNGACDNNGQDIFVSNAYQANEWVHVAYTHQAGNTNGLAYMYINGEQRGQARVHYCDLASPVAVGAIVRTTHPDEQLYTGDVDDIFMYNRVLTPDEIKLAMGFWFDACRA
eukprot:TRINITY_DN7718_c0_g1_i1.p1 TRINITY_DN7718_c0_g1~~TRINITY_DN7718_c0_g1_i1.p1  ORF type:complete len:694 (+),score=141.30 TRINITY_DN7718_c0_g1_i1:43-2124(+)